MIPKHTSVSEAFAILELEEDASFEQVKAAYRQKALRTHPDKNPGDPKATAEFQEVGAAYATLDKHFNRPTDSYGWDEDDSYSSDNSMGDMGFFIFVFDEVFGDRLGGARIRAHHFRRPPTPETDEQYQERMRQNREAQKLERERQAQLERERKIRRHEEAERERKAAEERQKIKVAQKKANAEAKKKATAEQLKNQREQAQTLRSSVFAAARGGNAVEVRKGVWEQAVDAAGGEVKTGSESYVKSPPKDPKETLMHIAAKQGDVELVEWLDAHSADPEERNSEGLTAFHVALKNGHMSIVKYFLENYSSKDSESRRSIYSLQSSASTSTLQYALESCIPEAVWLVLENKLCTESECKAAWKWIHSDETASRVLSSRLSKTGVSTDGKTQKKEDVLEEMRNLLSSYGGSTSPSQKVRTSKEEQKKQKATVEEYLPSPSDTSESSTLPTFHTNIRRQNSKQSSYRGRPKMHPEQYQSSSIPQSPITASSRADFSAQNTSSTERGRGRGRGRGRARGRAPQA